MIPDNMFSDVLAPCITDTEFGQHPPHIAMRLAEKLLRSLETECPRDVWQKAHEKHASMRYEIRWREAKADTQTAPMVASRQSDAWQYALYHLFRSSRRITELNVWREDGDA